MVVLNHGDFKSECFGKSWYKGLILKSQYL